MITYYAFITFPIIGKQEDNKMLSDFVKWLEEETISKSLLSDLEKILVDKNALTDHFGDDIKLVNGQIITKIGIGTAFINEITLGRIAKGILTYLQYNFENPTVVITYDSHQNSKEYACQIAEALSYKNIHVSLATEEMPLDFITYCLIKSSFDFGIAVGGGDKAHNYNGVTLYSQNGVRISAEISEEINNLISMFNYFKDVQYLDLKSALQEGKVNLLSAYKNRYYYRYLSSQVYPVQRPSRPILIISSKEVIKAYQNAMKIKNIDNFILLEADYNDSEEDFINSQKAYEKVQKLIKEYDAYAGILVSLNGKKSRLLSQDKVYKDYETGLLILDYLFKVKSKNRKLKSRKLIMKSFLAPTNYDLYCSNHQIRVIEIVECNQEFEKRSQSLSNDDINKRFVMGIKGSSLFFDLPNKTSNRMVSGLLIAAALCNYNNEIMRIEEIFKELFMETGYYSRFRYSLSEDEESEGVVIDNVLHTFRDFKTINQLFPAKILSCYDYHCAQKYYHLEAIEKIPLSIENAIKIIFEDNSSLLIRKEQNTLQLLLYATGKSEKEARQNREIYKKTFLKLIRLKGAKLH